MRAQNLYSSGCCRAGRTDAIIAIQKAQVIPSGHMARIVRGWPAFTQSSAAFSTEREIADRANIRGYSRPFAAVRHSLLLMVTRLASTLRRLSSMNLR